MGYEGASNGTPGTEIAPEYIADELGLTHKIAGFGTLLPLQLVPIFALVWQTW